MSNGGTSYRRKALAKRILLSKAIPSMEFRERDAFGRVFRVQVDGSHTTSASNSRRNCSAITWPSRQNGQM